MTQRPRMLGILAISAITIPVFAHTLPSSGDVTPPPSMRQRMHQKHERKKDHQQHMQAIKEAIEANDYDAFVAAHPEDMRDKITPEHFEKAKEKHAKMSEFSDRRHTMKKEKKTIKHTQRNAMMDAIKKNNYEAFLTAAPASIKAKITPDIFAHLVEIMHAHSEQQEK